MASPLSRDFVSGCVKLIRSTTRIVKWGDDLPRSESFLAREMAFAYSDARKICSAAGVYDEEVVEPVSDISWEVYDARCTLKRLTPHVPEFKLRYAHRLDGTLRFIQKETWSGSQRKEYPHEV